MTEDSRGRDVQNRVQGIGGGLGRPGKPGLWRKPDRLRIEADSVQEKIEGSVEAWERWTQEGSWGR